MNIFFKSPEHKERFVTTIQSIGKVYDGRIDTEYGSAIYILTEGSTTWSKACDYIKQHGIDFEAMQKEMDWSSGYSILVRLASNLFGNSDERVTPLEFMWLDEVNFQIALSALLVRRQSLLLADLKSE
jgi:hypothetical protein